MRPIANLFLLLSFAAFGGCAGLEKPLSEAELSALLAPDPKLQANLKRGEEIMAEILEMSPGEARLNSGKYRDEIVAISGFVAGTGGTNDLQTEQGIYVRVVNPQRKDLRPQAAWWSATVTGSIQVVIPENRIIVLEVEEEGWLQGQTG